MTAPIGELLARFEKSGRRARRRFLAWLIVSIGVAIFANQVELCLSVFALFFPIVVACQEGYRGFFMREESIEVYSDGFTIFCEDNRWDRSRLLYPYLWSELEEYSLFSQLGRHHYPLILRTSDGKEHGLNERYNDIYRLIEVLVRNSLEPLLTKTLSRLEVGEEVRFGEITVTSGGFQIGDESWPLEDIARVVRYQLDGTFPQRYAFAVSPRVHKKKKGGLALPGLGTGVRRIRSDSIPNVFVLAELIARFAPNLQRDDEGQAFDLGGCAATLSSVVKSPQEHPR